MRTWQKGDFVEVDGLIAIVVGVPGESEVPEEQLALWFGARHYLHAHVELLLSE